MTIAKFPVEFGHILTFARAVGEDNPIYFDEEYAKTTEAGGIIAPPTFVQAYAQFNPDTHLRPSAGKPWHGSGKTDGFTPDNVGGLHAEQHYEYHRHLKPGDVLTATTIPGKTWEREGKSGKLAFAETVIEYRDQVGALVITARSIIVRTERPVEQK
jgi:acyl dehydratase